MSIWFKYDAEDCVFKNISIFRIQILLIFYQKVFHEHFYVFFLWFH